MEHVTGPGSDAMVEGMLDGDGTAVLRLAGELDLASTAGVEATLGRLVSGASKVVVDLSGVTFMDSSGLAMLLRTREAIGDVIIVSASRPVTRIVQAAGLSEVLHLDDA